MRAAPAPPLRVPKAIVPKPLLNPVAPLIPLCIVSVVTSPNVSKVLPPCQALLAMLLKALAAKPFISTKIINNSFKSSFFRNLLIKILKTIGLIAIKQPSLKLLMKY
ncbi:hypothetical protein B0A58_15310 [Flavobacterium branchiophilum NBRC 15030 = ATCC 35035]|nr:hypothetical protein B0A58_15310 [Flavobacterium branchiophilum NBRC 15030 = ATCC 35035]